jgi:hypothetical protein
VHRAARRFRGAVVVSRHVERNGAIEVPARERCSRRSRWDRVMPTLLLRMAALFVAVSVSNFTRRLRLIRGRPE